MGEKRFNIISAICLVLALALNLGLSEWGAWHETVRFNGHVSMKGPTGAPILPVLEGGSFSSCIESPSCKVKSERIIYGLFARAGIPFDAALGGGLIIPTLLICIAIDRFFRKRIALALFWSAALVTVAGVVITGFSGYIVLSYVYAVYLGPHRISGPAPVWQYDLQMEWWAAFGFGLVLLVTATGLWYTANKKSAM